MRFCLRILGALAAVAPSNFAVAQEATAPDQSLVPYASTQESVRLPDGRWIHLVCAGEGSPSVILLAGVTDWSVAWNMVQPAVATKTRVCAWDRAGLGLSDPPAEPQMVDATTADLEAALAAARIEGPYVLVGHSVGAYESLLFADRRPAQVAGMVLVDPQYPDEVRLMSRLTPALTAFTERMSKDHPNPFVELFRRCAVAMRSGAIRKGGPDPDGCLSPQWPASYPPELKAVLDQRLDSATPETVAHAWEILAAINSLESLDANARMVVNADRNYGDMPLIVLTAGKANVPPGLPADVQAELPVSTAEWGRAHRELATLSSQGVNRIIEDSMHDIPHQNPRAVIEAIGEVVDQVRADPR